MIHLTIQQLSSYLDGEASESSRSVVQDHLAVCDACSAKYARLEHQEEGLVRALTSDQDEAFFDRLDGELSDRIAARGPAAAPVEPKPPAVPAAAGVRKPAEREPARASALTAREILGTGDFRPRKEPEDSLFTTRATPPKRSVFPWAAAITIFVIVGSIGAVNFGAEYASRWLNRTHSGDVHPAAGAGPLVADPDAAAGSSSIPAAAVSPGAVAVGSAPSALPGAAPEPSSSTAPSRPAAPFPSGSQAAKSAPAQDESDSDGPAWKPDTDDTTDPVDPSAEAGGPNSAATYDAIATSIERKLPMLQGDDYRSARYRLAEARYNAWRLEPNADRSAIVLRAIHAYLIGAPAGSDRETATGWLSEVESAGY